MKILELEDRLYTSTEVAKILGVSLRSVYRYLEDGKLDAEMKTATGRHRFTKQNILDFLSPQDNQRSRPAAAPVSAPAVSSFDSGTAFEEDEDEAAEVEMVSPATAAEEEEEDVDWLAKFRAAAAKYKTESEDTPEEEEVEEEATVVEAAPAPRQSVSGLADMQSISEPEEEEYTEEESNEHYYTSGVGGLKDIAQNLDRSARKASLDYAFTMDSGLSLHKPIRPFSVIHSYTRSEDLPFFEKILNLSQADKKDAQLCLVVSDSDAIYNESKEMHGLKVVSDRQLKKDLLSAGEDDLAAEVDA